MAITNFIPTVWSEVLYEELSHKYVVVANCNLDFDFDIKDIVINSGSEMIVAIAGDIIRMPGLPKVPQATKIDIIDGVIEGLS